MVVEVKTVKMGVYFLQGKIMCLLIIRKNKRKVKQRAGETKWFSLYIWQVFFIPWYLAHLILKHPKVSCILIPIFGPE